MNDLNVTPIQKNLLVQRSACDLQLDWRIPWSLTWHFGLNVGEDIFTCAQLGQGEKIWIKHDEASLAVDYWIVSCGCG